MYFCPQCVLGTFLKCPPLTCWVWTRWIGRHFLKTTKTYLLGTSLGKLVGTFQKCPAGFGLGEFVCTFWKCSPLTCWVWTGQIVSKPTINSQCTRWVNCPLPPVTSCHFLQLILDLVWQAEIYQNAPYCRYAWQPLWFLKPQTGQ